jgi:hypothetical protein
MVRRLRAHAFLAFASLAVGLGLACTPASPPPTSGDDDANRTSSAARPVVPCNGAFGDQPSDDGNYYATSFGCWVDDNGKQHKDPGDNCIPGCLADAQKDLCANMSGPECERQTKWFSADAARYGCLARLRVTNPKSGRSVVVIALDNGPSCSVEKSVNHAVLDLSYPATDYLFGEAKGAVDKATVSVEVVDASTPLGPADQKAQDGNDPNGNGGDQGAGGAGAGDAPEDWTCDPTYYSDGVCDCQCGADDPDCNGQCGNGNGGGGADPGQGDGAGGSDPGASGGSAPDGWTCDPSWYGDGQYCDCDCGVDDTDCNAGQCDGGGDQGAGGSGQASNGAPDGWTCDPAWYADGQYCDCNCGIDDPDCSQGC